MGDVEQGIDPTLLARGLPRVDLLKIAHHGSATATTQAFVDAVRPRVAIASAGADNPYGHPAGSTLGRLRASGARVYRTDQDGSVEVDLRADGMVVNGDRPEAGGRAAAGGRTRVRSADVRWAGGRRRAPRSRRPCRRCCARSRSRSGRRRGWRPGRRPVGAGVVCPHPRSEPPFGRRLGDTQPIRSCP